MSHISNVTVVHGDYQKVSREFLHDFLNHALSQGFSEQIHLDGRDFSLTDLVEACESASLLSQNRIVILENLHSNRSKTFLKIIDHYLTEIIHRSQKSPTNPLVLWESKLLTPAQLRPYAGASIKTFKIPIVIFKFLESIAPGKQAVFIPKYRHLIKTEAPEVILLHIARQVRLLIQVADPEFKLDSWKLKRLIAQRQLFSDTELITLHDNIVDLDRRAKSGKLVGALGDELLVLLAKI